MQAVIEPRSGSLFTRRPMDVEDYLNVVRRHLGWILGPALAGLTLAVVVAMLWPDTYRSVATLRIVPPAIPTRLVDPTFNTRMVDRINAMKQTILSRNILTSIIQTHNLYPKDREKAPIEDIVEKMSEDIVVGDPRLLAGGAGNTAVFGVSFSYHDRALAHKVTRDLVSRFMDDNVRERSNQVKQTTEFLREQFNQAKVELDAIESRLTDFKVANASRLPETMGVNLQAMSALEARVSSLNSSISRAKQEQTLIESELRATRERLNNIARLPAEGPAGSVSAGVSGAADPADEELSRVERELAVMERTLDRMLEQYRPTYPDVQRLKARINGLKKERDDLLSRRLTVREPGQAAAPDRTAVSTPRVNTAKAREMAELEAHITRLQGQIRAKEMEAERYVREIAEAERRSGEVQRRIEVGPLSSAQIEQLTRDHELAKRKYDDLKSKLSQAEIGQEIEARKQGETLDVLDPASMPQTPTAPNRPVIIGAGVVLGLMIGGALATIREAKDTSLKSLKDIRAYTQFNVLGSVPLLENDLVVRRRRRLNLLGWMAAILFSVMTISGAIYYYNNVLNP
jgi:polysaccharide chain length determinant protein (PEP-CTERM system associated)